MFISKDIVYVGVNDHETDLFEGHYLVPGGMSYNSYVILDEKTAVMDTVDRRFCDQWLGNVEAALDGRAPDYIVVHHMEPDHSSSLKVFLEKYPQTAVVANSKTFVMIENYFHMDIEARKVVVENGGTLTLGAHELTFVFAPMVHWPEVMVSYDSADKVLFSADAFGKFGALDVDEPWEDEARRYYIGIVGKYGGQVQTLLKKAAGLDIAVICPLHGPVLKENLGHYIGLYDTWSAYRPEEEGVLVAYTSVYGHTKAAAELLAEKLRGRGCNVVIRDLARCDMAAAIADAFKMSATVLATTTYNADIFPYMRQFIDGLTERNFQNRTLGLIENGSWAPVAAKVMQEMLSRSKNITYLPESVRILSSMTAENEAQLEAMADALAR